MVVCALILVFESGIVSKSTVALSVNTHQYLAQAVGMSASVEPTELNSITAELTKQKLLLDKREAAVAEREIRVNVREASDPNTTAVYVLSVIVFILLLLIITNYILDYLRARELAEKRTFKPV